VLREYPRRLEQHLCERSAAGKHSWVLSLLNSSLLPPIQRLQLGANRSLRKIGTAARVHVDRSRCNESVNMLVLRCDKYSGSAGSVLVEISLQLLLVATINDTECISPRVFAVSGAFCPAKLDRCAVVLYQAGR
jgi:hypothetical protein